MVIQSRLEKSKSKPTDGDISNTFNKLMLQGRINVAIRLLSQTKNSGVFAELIYNFSRSLNFNLKCAGNCVSGANLPLLYIARVYGK